MCNVLTIPSLALHVGSRFNKIPFLLAMFSSFPCCNSALASVTILQCCLESVREVLNAVHGKSVWFMLLCIGGLLIPSYLIHVIILHSHSVDLPKTPCYLYTKHHVDLELCVNQLIFTCHLRLWKEAHVCKIWVTKQASTLCTLSSKHNRYV